ncbi:unnamed protein product [Mesocestoides corti]|uniref:peptidyl-tRNA hydrolase n=1 Tax=Mesocestoides corti TaxID=53468 RepID=A0A0R3U8C4_MESCO|nr:unnamed protein product [Mesocestoides corti]
MDALQPVVQALLTAGFGFCLGWYFRKGSLVRKALPISRRFVKGPFKLVLVVRGDLGMTKGKVAAQCSHATLGCYKNALKACPEVVKAWEKCGQMKVVLKALDYESLEELELSAEKEGLPHCLVHDAGHTQVPAGSATVLGIGPGLPTHELLTITF